MTKKTIIAMLMTLSVATACTARENPLTKVDHDALVSWLMSREEPVKKKMDACGEFWAKQAGTTIPADFHVDCNQLAGLLASDMSNAGFGSIQREDVYLATLWVDYIKLRKFNAPYDPDAAAAAVK